MKILYLIILLTISIKALASQPELPHSAYLKCNTCTDIYSFKEAAKDEFNSEYILLEDQTYYFTVVNDVSALGALVKVFHYWEFDSELNKEVSVVLVAAETGSIDMAPVYNFAHMIFTPDGETKPIEITINSDMNWVSTAGIAGVRPEISAQLKSKDWGGVSWAHLAGRAVISVTTSDGGSFLVFFNAINSTTQYIYLAGTAINANGDLISIFPLPSTPNVGGSGVSTGSSGGIYDNNSSDYDDAAKWIVRSGTIVCTRYAGGEWRCMWMQIP